MQNLVAQMISAFAHGIGWRVASQLPMKFVYLLFAAGLAYLVLA